MSNSLRHYGLQSVKFLCPWGFSRQECWSGLPCPPPGDLPNPGIELRSPTLQVDSLLSEPPGQPQPCLTSLYPVNWCLERAPGILKLQSILLRWAERCLLLEEEEEAEGSAGGPGKRSCELGRRGESGGCGRSSWSTLPLVATGRFSRSWRIRELRKAGNLEFSVCKRSKRT